MKTKIFTILILSLTALVLLAGCSTAEPEAMILAWPPAGEPVDPNPILQWQAFEGAAEYLVTVTAEGAPDALFEQKTAETNIPVVPALAPGDYTWHVAALDGDKVLAQLDSDFSVKDAITLVSPVAFETVGAEPELKWQPYPGAVSYQVIVIDDEAFPPVVVCEHTTAETAYVVEPPLEPSSYSWRVWAFDGSNKLVAELNSNIVVETAQ